VLRDPDGLNCILISRRWTRKEDDGAWRRVGWVWEGMRLNVNNKERERASWYKKMDALTKLPYALFESTS
jgi:hypothetical protein